MEILKFIYILSTCLYIHMMSNVIGILNAELKMWPLRMFINKTRGRKASVCIKQSLRAMQEQIRPNFLRRTEIKI